MVTPLPKKLIEINDTRMMITIQPILQGNELPRGVIPGLQMVKDEMIIDCLDQHSLRAHYFLF